MIYWDEGATEGAPPDVVDVAFRLTAPALPGRHAHLLAEALGHRLPATVTPAIHPLTGSDDEETGAEDTAPLLHLSSRTRLRLRAPREAAPRIQALAHQSLDLAGHPLTLGAASIHALHPYPTLYAQRIADPDGDETHFLDAVAAAQRALGVPPRKLLCGRAGHVATPTGPLATRSLMVADLEPDESLWLQARGIGEYMTIGCGVFVGHKGPMTGSGA